ncbi:MAG: protein kinase [Acidobacteriota bacterium]
MPPPSPSTPDAPKKKLGRYEIQGELARGAMGTVYKAIDPSLGRVVALKVMSTALSTSLEEEIEFRARFEREAKICAALRHPGIVQVHDAGSDPAARVSFIAMEFVEGETLKDRLDRQRRFTVKEAVDIAIHVAQALGYAHENRVVHRDIKPSNILLANDGDIKITDFGVARVPGSDLTRTGVNVGTPNFMAPEQVKGRVADGRSDIFSLGVILYWMLTAKRPFGADDPAKVAYRTVNVLPVPPDEVNGSIPRELSRVVLKSLEKDPAKRYQKASEMADDLWKVRDSLDGAAAPAPSPEPASSPPAPTPVAAQAPHASPAPPASTGATRGRLPLYAAAAAGLAFLVVAIVLVAMMRRGPRVAALPAPTPPTPVALATPTVGVEQTWDVAVDYYRAGRYDDSAREFQKILDTDPGNQNVLKYLGLIEEARRTPAALPADGGETPAPAPDTGATATPVETPVGTPVEPPATAPGTSPAPTNPPSTIAKATAVTPTPAPSPVPTKALPALPGPAPPTRLSFSLSHKLESGQIEVAIDGQRTATFPLTGEKLAFGRVRGDADGDVTFSSGKHVVSFHVTGVRAGQRFDVEKATGNVDFAPRSVARYNLNIDKDGALSVVAAPAPSVARSP